MPQPVDAAGRARAHRAAWRYLGLALLLSWSYWGVLLALGLRVDAGGGAAHPGVSHLPGLLGPALAGWLAACWSGGAGAGRAWLRQALRNWPRPAWRGVLMALSPLCAGAALWVGWAATGQALPPWVDFVRFPGIPQSWAPWAVVLAVVLVNGLGEELGWRGYLLEVLLAHHSRWTATCAVVGAWLVWHAPLFWLNASMAALVGPLLLGWALGLACGGFVLAQVYLWSGRSVLVVALWHAAYNLVVATPAGHAGMAPVLSGAVMVWGLVTAQAWWRARMQRRVD